MTTPDAPLVLRNVVKRFGDKLVLDGVDLALPRGSVVGLLRPQAGRCELLGEDAWALSAAAKARLGYVPQVVSLYPWMKVKQLLDYVRSFYAHWNGDLIAKLSREWSLPADDRVGNLSVGQTQKLAILVSLGHEPELLVLDEPAAALDPLARRQFLQLLIDIAEPGRRTVLFSTHITSDLERVADRVAIFKSGRTAFFGPIDELKERTNLNLEDSFLEMQHA
ncbi:MAG TPA: ABC transporter ATP-binding protein [Tepidisphaeraceae bacterium]|nr:ABC transporter ATP-binding protein [Tepidisphaeraceae bacterium]